MSKKKTKGVPMPESMIMWLIGLEDQGALVSRHKHVIRKPEWPFVVRVVADSETNELMLLAGYRTEEGVAVGGQPVARGEEQIMAEVSRLLALDKAQIEAIGDAMLARAFPNFKSLTP